MISLRKTDDAYYTNARLVKSAMLRVLSAVYMERVCDEVNQAWADFMEKVKTMPIGEKWGNLPMPDLNRSMFGRLLFSIVFLGNQSISVFVF